jgi:hypothetical protein
VLLVIASEAAAVAIFISVRVDQSRDVKKILVLGAVKWRAKWFLGPFRISWDLVYAAEIVECGNLQGVRKSNNQLAMRLGVEPVMTAREWKSLLLHIVGSKKVAIVLLQLLLVF